MIRFVYEYPVRTEDQRKADFYALYDRYVLFAEKSFLLMSALLHLKFTKKPDLKNFVIATSKKRIRKHLCDLISKNEEDSDRILMDRWYKYGVYLMGEETMKTRFKEYTCVEPIWKNVRYDLSNEDRSAIVKLMWFKAMCHVRKAYQ